MATGLFAYTSTVLRDVSDFLDRTVECRKRGTLYMHSNNVPVVQVSSKDGPLTSSNFPARDSLPFPKARRALQWREGIMTLIDWQR